MFNIWYHPLMAKSDYNYVIWYHLTTQVITIIAEMEMELPVALADSVRCNTPIPVISALSQLFLVNWFFDHTKGLRLGRDG